MNKEGFLSRAMREETKCSPFERDQANQFASPMRQVTTRQGVQGGVTMATPWLWLALSCATLAFATGAAGIHLKLTHVDAKQNDAVEERARTRTRRRMASTGGLEERARTRTRRRMASTGGVAAPVHWAWARTQYIAEYLIGDPPQAAEAIVDTGSNLVWTQCSACAPFCLAQNLPYYDHSRSRAAAVPAPCGAAACALGGESRCAGDGRTCAVVTSYGFGDVAGVLGTEAFTFGSGEKVTLAFGCVTAARLSPESLAGASGILGLGRGALSLPSQLGAAKFAYCLTRYFSDGNFSQSHLFVGASAGLIAGSPATAVPFVESPKEGPFNGFYYLPLAGITVGDAKLAVPAAAFGLRQVAPGKWAGTVIDSGTPFTSLVDVAYRALRAAAYDLCVAPGDVGRLVPLLTLHFGGDGGGGGEGDVVVPPESYWKLVDMSASCMVVFSSAARPNATLPMNETTFIGNFMTQDMHLLYDLGNGVLSFQPADCSSL
ncbi:hypothetical protein ACP4OV_023205 [Aristida adscensionis]